MSFTRIKICGITDQEDALAAAELGVDLLGFIFCESPRQMSPEKVRGITQMLPERIASVGVFVDEELPVVASAFDVCGLDFVQLHGKESPEYCHQLEEDGISVIKSFRVKDAASLEGILEYKVTAYLLDTYKEGKPGGTGETFDWKLAVKTSEQGVGPVFLSGGLDPLNVADAIKFTAPYAVDVSSGVELSPGRKDISKMTAFVEQVRSVWD